MSGSQEEPKPASSKNSATGVIGCLLGGLWLLAGAIYQLALHKWFPLFPVQIDGVFGFASAIFGTNGGLYVSSFVAGFLGVGLLWLATGLGRHG